MALPTLAEYRARGIALPVDDLVAQDVIDGEEAWLARRIGILEGERTETFHVGYGRTTGRLALARYTSSVVLADGGVAVSGSHFRLVDRGAGIERVEAAPGLWWTGPYVAATYTPNDLDEVRRALYDLVALSAQPVSEKKAEQIGAYSYSGGGVSGRTGARAVIASSLIPKRDPLVSMIAVSRRLHIEDPVINRAESPL